MRFHWTDWTAIAVIAGVGCVAIFAGLKRVMRRALRERQRDMERELNAMATTVKALEARVAELSKLQAARVEQAKVAVISESAETAEAPEQAQTQPEIVAALTAAATAFLGRKARVRSAKLIPNAQESAAAWAQQGRMIVQTSHNLRQRG